MYDPSCDEALEQAAAALQALQAVDLTSLDQEALARWTVAVHALKKRADALATAATGAFDRYGDPEGAVGAAPWVAWKCRVRKEEAKAELARARALRSMPVTATAYAAGEISSDHVRLLAAAWRAASDAFESKEEQLVADAMDLRFDAFRRRILHFRLEHDRSGSDERSAEATDRRELHASRSFEDCVIVNGVLEPLGGSIYLGELQRIESKLFEEDWAEARARLGDAAGVFDLRRSPAQRRADAQVIMAVRSSTMSSRRRQAAPLFTVHVGYETFAGMLSQLSDGTVVNPTALVPWLDATLGDDLDVGVAVERVVFDAPSRVVDVGVRQRCFVGGTRRSVEARDLFCTHESCDVPYERCDIDHVQPYAAGGLTVQANGRVRCPHHNPGRRRPYQPPPDDDDP